MEKWKTTFIIINLGLCNCLICLALATNNISNANGLFPKKVHIINRQNASYHTPEETYTSMLSSLYNKNLNWYYETLTTKAALRNKELYEKAGVSPLKKFETINDQKEFYILKKFPYKDGLVLIIRSQKTDGTILQGPSTMIKKGNEWKITNRYSSDEKMHEYMGYYKRSPVKTTTEVTYSGVRYNRRTRQFYSAVTVTNISNQKMEGPVWLKIKNLRPKGAILANADGTHFDEPYVILLDEEKKWPPGGKLPAKTLYFKNPVRQRLSFDDQVFAVVPEESP